MLEEEGEAGEGAAVAVEGNTITTSIRRRRPWPRARRPPTAPPSSMGAMRTTPVPRPSTARRTCVLSTA